MAGREGSIEGEGFFFFDMNTVLSDRDVRTNMSEHVWTKISRQVKNVF